MTNDGAPRDDAGDERSARARILASATRLFGTYGYHGASLRDIARDADLQPGLIHYYFRSKENLLFEIAWASAERHRRDVAALVAGEGAARAKLAALARLRVRNSLFEESWDLNLRRYRETLMTPAHARELTAALRETLTMIETLVGEAARELGNAAPQPHAVTQLLLAMGDGVRRWYRPGGPLTIEQIGDIAADLTIRALSPPPASEGEAAVAP